MYVLIISLASYEVEEEPNLNSYILKNNDEQTVFDVLNAHYDVDKDSFHFYEAHPHFDASGVFSTVESDVDEDEEDPLRLDWVFEVQEARYA